MPEYDNTNRGQIWKNDRKEKDTHPDYTGDANIDGVEYWISAWRRDPDANPKAPALRFSFKSKEESNGQSNQSQAAPGFDGTEDDIPF